MSHAWTAELDGTKDAKSWGNLRFPVLEMFFFRRVIFDELHELVGDPKGLPDTWYLSVLGGVGGKGGSKRASTTPFSGAKLYIIVSLYGIFTYIYGIFTYIYHKNQQIGKYTIYGWYRYGYFHKHMSDDRNLG